MRSRNALWGLLAGLGFLAGVIAACGGSTSSGTGPSSGGGGGGGGSSTATIQGQLLRGTGSAQGESVMVVVFRNALGIGLAEAAPTTPLAGATVTLSGPGGPFTTTTAADGTFSFTGLLPGTYTFSVCAPLVPNGPCVARTIETGEEITVGPGDLGTINGTVFNDDTTALSVSIVAEPVTAEGILQNDAQLCIASRLAEGAGVPLQTIIDLRLAGNGWGKIAKLTNQPAGNIGGGIHCPAAGNGKGKGPGNNKGKKKGQI